MTETTRAVRRSPKPVTFPELTLTADNVLVEVIDPPKQTAGGLIFPDSAECFKTGHEGALAGRIHEGIVRACGPGKRDKLGNIRPLEVAPGDHVKFYYFGDYFLNWPDSRHRIMAESQIQAVFEA